LVSKITELTKALDVPLIVKEVGWGISVRAAEMLRNAGVSAIDVAGAGGTSWSQVEMHRIKDPLRAETAACFADWGNTTVESILNVRHITQNLPLFASGGLRTGIDVAKCLALGANMGGMASPFLKAANETLESTVRVMQNIVDQIRIAIFACGAKTLKDLDPEKLTPAI
jgi:isopentenyl-diphosphate delta-isomerase